MPEKKLNTVIRKGKFDAGHRVMHERFKCFNVHGHEYGYELEFSYNDADPIGYAIDFKEIKRVACEWIDERMDHAFIANPSDDLMVETCLKLKSKLFLMHLIDAQGFCNPTAENIAKELFYAVSHLMNDGNLKLERVILYETVNCRVECTGLWAHEVALLDVSLLRADVAAYRKHRGRIEYDERKTTSHQ